MANPSASPTTSSVERLLAETAKTSSSEPPATANTTDTDSGNDKKRPATTTEPNGSTKITKRRAARACVSCRARKVRCDVVEGAPCGNCRWDNVECVVQESRRRKKSHLDPNATGSSNSAPHGPGAEAHLKAKTVHHPVNIAARRRQSEVSQISSNNGSEANHNPRPSSLDPSSASAAGVDSGSIPHLQYQGASSGQQIDPLLLAKLRSANLQHVGGAAGNGGSSRSSNSTPNYPNILPNLANVAPSTAGNLRTAQFINSLEDPDASSHLPTFIRPLPAKIAAEDVNYLHLKGALTLPNTHLQNALLRAYIEFVHPYMPLIELFDFLSIVNSKDGLCGQTSLFLYQCIMFAATAYVDAKHLKEAGYETRKVARKAFFSKARLLYDFDYESDRLVLVQGLLLMTYWYETPDDQKDTWHWMGVAISLAHTIGLHRNPAHTSMMPQKQKLWKRIWWSCFMRDRLIALGMRRPTRIKDEDFDVPMLHETDFEVGHLPAEIEIVGPECILMRDILMQQELALMCIQKAKLCLCISHMLKAQYSVLIRDKTKPENTTNSTMMLFPNKQFENLESVTACDMELNTWKESLPQCCQYRPLSSVDVKNGRATIAVQRDLLHMVYHTTVSALHRPQFLPSSPAHTPQTSAHVQEVSRMRVRDSAMHVTRMVSELHALRLEKYLPTTGVTVILPAMIIHLLEMKSANATTRDTAFRGFKMCMKVMERLRDLYAAADYAVGFLDAALRKAAMDAHLQQAQGRMASTGAATGSRMSGMKPATPFAVPPTTTPPPDNNLANSTANPALFDLDSNNKNDELPANFLQQQQFVSPTDMPEATNPTAFFPSAKLFGGSNTESNRNPASNPFNESINSPSPSAHHNKDANMLTPSASSAESHASTSENGSSRGHAGGAPGSLDSMDMMDDPIFDTTQGGMLADADEFDWNALTGSNIDFDQWLQFPPVAEGGGVGGPPSAAVPTASAASVAAAAGGVSMADVDGGIGFAF